MAKDFFDRLMVERVRTTQQREGCYAAARAMRFMGFPFEFALEVLQCNGDEDTAQHTWDAYIIPTLGRQVYCLFEATVLECQSA